MFYQIYKLDFLNNVHFGRNALDDSKMTFCADTLFSALFQETLKMGRQDEFYQLTERGSLLFSDAFPYVGKRLYLPKPCARIASRERSGNSTEKKKFKKIKYIAAGDLEAWFRGTYSPDAQEELKGFCRMDIKVSAAIRGQEEPELYRVKYVSFAEGSGLYFIAGAEGQEHFNMLDELMTALSYSGIGGKRYAGMGRFDYMSEPAPEALERLLDGNAKRYMLLSGAMPCEEELPDVLEGADYQLSRRGGFVASEHYAEQQMRKKDLYVFEAGGCFNRRFDGMICDVSSGGRHPVWRYAKGMFVGVSV